ncbi:MAG: DEAD/DEAH box helicase [Chloroflexota bacterium]|nr:DEAD/DEAH box helicase [Chloroflexota bacterium]
MIVLHGIWSGSALHIWGEDSAPLQRTGAAGRAGREPRPHPFAVDLAGLREALKAVLGSTFGSQGRGVEVRLRLPSAGARPMSSPELLLDEAGVQTQKRLVAWKVPSLELPPLDALSLLAAVADGSPSGICEGASLRYWAEAGKLCLELLAQGRFLPDVEEASDSVLKAVWRPLLEEGDLPERRRLLIRAMPPVCRALGAGGKEASPSALVESFLVATVDAAVRHALGSQPIAVAPKRLRPTQATLPERWLRSLASEDPRVAAPAGQAAAFLNEVREWTGQLALAGREAGFRTCFRLEPPEEPAKEGRGRKKPPPWVVSFHLQAVDDRSLLIDASRVWTERSAVLTFLERRFENPQERLLADLGRACRLFPPLEEGLKSPRPVASGLTTEDAYRFLREAAPLLEESGFGVLVPPWWQKPQARLGVRVRVKSKGDGKAGASGLLGLDSLVEFDWEAALGDQTLTREELERLAALKVPLVRVRGQWVELRPEEIDAALRFLQGKRGRMGLGELLRLGLAGEGAGPGLPVVAVEGEGWLRQLLEGLDSAGRMEEIPAPERFQGTLRPYQLRGLSWLAFLDRYGLGACLADDMGLGKTVQLIALLLHERSNGNKPGPTLLIAPMSVVGNWRREVERFGPSLRAMVHHGGERLSGRAFAREAKRHDLVISTYALAQRDREQLAAVPWHRVALDEAQNIKNPSAKQTQAVRSLKASHRVALTGTPVENRLSELWSIMEFLNAGYLGSAESFQRRFATPIERYRDAERMAGLRRLVGPFILRRLKTDPAVIQDLPEKMEMKVFCNLTREQASLYQAVVKEMMEKVEESEGIERKGQVLAALTKLKQVCDHPALFLHDESALDGRSGKVLRLGEMLEEVVAAGDRALVFTQFAEMGQMLKAHLQEALEREVLFLHGGTSRKARDEMVQRFQSTGQAPPVFILSLKAGGLGLNLTAANHVFHFDRWWNPAVENQATDRAFRIGQRKNVQVHKYVCAGTLEERIDQLMETKRALAESVIGTGEAWLTEMSTEQLRELLALSSHAVVEG